MLQSAVTDYYNSAFVDFCGTVQVASQPVAVSLRVRAGGVGCAFDGWLDYGSAVFAFRAGCAFDGWLDYDSAVLTLQPPSLQGLRFAL
jgi:hypothetical protein